MLDDNHSQRAGALGFALAWRLALPALVGAGASLIVGAATVTTAEAKSPGARYCFHGYCHRVGMLAQTDTLVGGAAMCSPPTTTAAISTGQIPAG
jgi:rare lipoprotein A